MGWYSWGWSDGRGVLTAARLVRAADRCDDWGNSYMRDVAG
jgi:hypothetical protein